MLIECYYQEKKDSQYISILEDFCDDNGIDLSLYESIKDKTPIVIICDDYGVEIANIKGNFSRAKLKDIYNEALY